MMDEMTPGGIVFIVVYVLLKFGLPFLFWIALGYGAVRIYYAVTTIADAVEAHAPQATPPAAPAGPPPSDVRANSAWQDAERRADNRLGLICLAVGLAVAVAWRLLTN